MDLKSSFKDVARRTALAAGVTSQLEGHTTTLNELSAVAQRIEQRSPHVDRGTQILLALKYRELAGQRNTREAMRSFRRDATCGARHGPR